MTSPTLEAFRRTCNRCAHSWLIRGDHEPAKCPKCMSVLWNRPRKNRVKPKALPTANPALDSDQPLPLDA